MGDEGVGVFTGGWYAAGLETPDNKKFVAAINDAYKHDPGFYTAGPYTALLIIEEALKTTGGKTDDAAAFLKAMHDVRLTHGPIGPVRARRIRHACARHSHPQGGAGERQTHQHHHQDLSAGEPVLDHTIQSNSIQQPVFSRDFPPSKYLE